MSEHDTRFSLPSVDDSPSTEAGIILMGLDAERLLAGLGLATLADDPASVTLAVDQARHGALHPTSAGLIEAGASRWRALRATLEMSGLNAGTAGSLRQSWERTARILTATLDDAGPASLAYLTACWFRREDVDKLAAGSSS